jgi:hypothetical protein
LIDARRTGIQNPVKREVLMDLLPVAVIAGFVRAACCRIRLVHGRTSRVLEPPTTAFPWVSGTWSEVRDDQWE